MPNWKRSLYVLWVVQFMSTTALTLGLTFVPFFLRQDPALRITDESERLWYTSLILAGPFFTTILFAPLWGWVADRTGRKRQVVRATFGLGLSQLLIGFAQTPEQIVALRVIQGVISGVQAANLGLLAAGTPEAHQGRALSTYQSATPAGLIFGPVLGGFLATTLGYRNVYFLLGGAIVAAGFLVAFLIREERFVPQKKENPYRALVDALSRSFVNDRMRFAYGVLFLTQFAWTLVQVVFAIYAGKLINWYVFSTGIKSSWWNLEVGFTSICMTLTGLANFLLSLYWGRAYDRKAPYLTPIGAGAMAVSAMALAFWPPWWLVMLARTGTGAGMGAVITLQYPAISVEVPASDRGRFMGLATAVVNAGSLAGFLLGGLLAHGWGESGNFVLATGIYLAVGVVALARERSGARAKGATPATTTHPPG